MYECICLFVIYYSCCCCYLRYFILFYFITFFLYRQSVYCSSSYYLENPDLIILGRHRLHLILLTAGVQVVHGSRTGSRLANCNNAIMALVMAWRRDSWRPGAPSPSSAHPSPGITTYWFFFVVFFCFVLFCFVFLWGGGGSIGDLVNGLPYLLAILNAWTVPEFVRRPWVREGNIFISM